MWDGALLNKKMSCDLKVIEVYKLSHFMNFRGQVVDY